MTRFEFVWQYPSWPENLRWDHEAILDPVANTAAKRARAFATISSTGLDLEADSLVEEAVTTAAIEGEKLDRDSVRSSVAYRLGLETSGLPKAPARHVEGLVDVLADATRAATEPLTEERLFGWHQALFPTGYSGLTKIEVAKWRTSTDAMQVVSGTLSDRTTVHFEAPPSSAVPAEMAAFLAWWADSGDELNGLVRAAVAHFRFLTIHPLADGNGRIARVLTDMALAQDDGAAKRYFSMSREIVERRSEYYQVLEEMQRDDGDITPWILWFLSTLEAALDRSMSIVEATRQKASFWDSFSHVSFNDRQKKVIAKLVEAGPGGFVGGMTNKKYTAIAKTSAATAKRDLGSLVDAGVLSVGKARGRGAYYELVWPS